MHMKYWLYSTISFAWGVGHFRRIFHRERGHPTNQCWCQKTKVIAISCGIKLSAVHRLVLSQYKHLSDRQMDRQVEIMQ